MTDQPVPTPEDELREEARRDLETPPEPIPDAAGLPDDVPDERVPDDDGSTVDHHEGD